ncbi:unnamed protein product, partial [Mesorhabditis belari]|uniref:Uncharacterized protein n=1 Tax=Mesorhabditis belari TaxID=2138241 RepID=A0AAF3E9B3_9BILA
MTAATDEENPSVLHPSRKVLGIFKDPEPGFATTAISIIANFAITNMFIYGLTGNGKFAYLASTLTVPCSVFLCVRDQAKDYEKWKELSALRQKGIPDRFMPYKCRYDWTAYEQRERSKAAITISE